MVFCNMVKMNILVFQQRHNPYFNRWFSAITLGGLKMLKEECHNPYFNRWFSAIELFGDNYTIIKVTILILIDGFLQ